MCEPSQAVFSFSKRFRGMAPNGAFQFGRDWRRAVCCTAEQSPWRREGAVDGFEPCHGCGRTRRKQGHPEVLLRSAAMGPTGIGRGTLAHRGNRPWNPSAPSELSLSGYHMNLRRDPRVVIPLAYGE